MLEGYEEYTYRICPRTRQYTDRKRQRAREYTGRTHSLGIQPRVGCPEWLYTGLHPQTQGGSSLHLPDVRI